MPEISAAKVGFSRASQYNSIVYAEINGKELIYVDLKSKSKIAQIHRIKDLLTIGSIRTKFH